MMEPDRHPHDSDELGEDDEGYELGTIDEEEISPLRTERPPASDTKVLYIY